MSIDPLILINEVCEFNSIKVSDFNSSSNERAVSKSQQQVIYILKEFTTSTFKEVSEILGYKLSKTNWNYKKIAGNILYDNNLRSETEQIANKVLQKYGTSTKVVYLENRIEELYSQYLAIKKAHKYI